MGFTCMWQKCSYPRRLFMRRSRGVGTGGPDNPSHMENYKVVDFLRNTGLEPLKSTKLPMSVHRRTTSQAPLK